MLNTFYWMWMEKNFFLMKNVLKSSLLSTLLNCILIVYTSNFPLDGIFSPKYSTCDSIGWANYSQNSGNNSKSVSYFYCHHVISLNCHSTHNFSFVSCIKSHTPFNSIRKAIERVIDLMNLLISFSTNEPNIFLINPPLNTLSYETRWYVEGRMASSKLMANISRKFPIKFYLQKYTSI